MAIDCMGKPLCWNTSIAASHPIQPTNSLRAWRPSCRLCTRIGSLTGSFREDQGTTICGLPGCAAAPSAVPLVGQAEVRGKCLASRRPGLKAYKCPRAGPAS